ncbi:MAG: sialidase family protein, partial [Bryobacteraceae bacterium]
VTREPYSGYPVTVILLALLLSLRLSPDSLDTPFKQPQLAVSKDVVALTYGAGKVVYFAGSRDGAATFSKPVQVASAPHLALGRHRGPRIAFAKSTIVISANIATLGGGKDGDLVAWRSIDGGKTWSAASPISDIPGAAREGLHKAASPDGVLMAAWLDLRDKKMSLYGSFSRDGGASWSKNQLIYASPDGKICECCHPSLYVTPDGQFHVMWRNNLEGSRDMWLASSSNRGQTWTSQKLGRGTWPLNACPMDGGGLSVDPAGRLQSVWRRDGGIYTARPGEQEMRAGKGKDPAIAGRYIAWTDELSIKFAEVGQESKVLSEDGAFVSLAGTGRVYAAWEEKGAIIVRKLGE